MSQSKRKQLLNWIKSHPDLDHIRKLANQTKVQYNRNEKDPTQRIRVYNRAKYKTRKSLFSNLVEIFWVPGRNLRGKAYSDPNLDQQLNQTASIMSLSTIWDFVCTSPVIYYFAKGSDSLMCHVNNFKQYDKTVATYGYKRGTGELLKRDKN